MDEAGYSIHPSVLTAARCEALAADPLLASAVGRAGARHLLRHALIREVADELRPLAVAVLGAEAVAFRATYFDKSPKANWLVPWHQDTALPLEQWHQAPGWGPWSVKDGVHYAHAPTAALTEVIALRLHLDDSTTSNGPLRVIPGSHRHGVLSDDDVNRIAAGEKSTECLVPLGGVLRMSPLIIHASGKVTDDRPRRVLHIEYASRLTLAGGWRLRLC